MDSEHAAKVGAVARQLRELPPGSVLQRHKRSVSHVVPKRSWQRPPPGRRLDLSALDRILELDVENRTCTCEAGVTFEQLVRATLPRGLAPAVVPELKTITVGGAVSGCSIESMSFRHGGFHDSCLEYEVLTATGERLLCTPDNEHALLFQMLHGTFGTLGVICAVKLRLVPARRFVNVEYERYTQHAGFEDAVRRHAAADDVDFMDGYVHGPERYVLSTARFSATAPYTRRYDWMREYCESTEHLDEDWMTTEQYFFRYDRGITHLWPRAWLGRLLFGRLSTSTNRLKLANRFEWLLPKREPKVFVDTFLPLSRAARFLDWYRREVGAYPLWLVPYRRVRDYEWISPEFFRGLDDDLFLDIAIYGVEQRAGQNLYREIEVALNEIGGIKTLISHNYYPREEFWRIWNRDNYEKVKARVDPANVFRDLYEKTCPLACSG